MGLRSGYELARSRLCVLDDYYFPAYVVNPRQGTTLVQAWHASGAFKKFGYSLTGKTFGADASVLRRVRIHSTYHLCLVSTMRVAAHYAEAFGLPAERFTSRIGIPRTDSLLDPAWRDRTADAIRRRYSIPGDRRVVLYAPTFRGTSVTRARDAATLDLALLRERLGNTHFVLARRHPFVRGRGALAETLAGFGADVSEHPDIHELMTVTDVLVTDYSSAIFEFALLGRPIAFLAPDLAQYEHERGFYLDYRRDVPGPIFDTTAALAKHLRAGEFDLDRVRRFAADAFDVADGHAAERFVEEIVRPALGTSR
jgi:CDP-ribitol ribitolphosphotransferase